MELLAAHVLRSAAKTFRVGTTVVDHWHVRSFGLLSDQGLDSLALMMGVWECGGDFPSPMRLVITKLIPKPTGGRRPIGLFGAVVRLWGRARGRDTMIWQRRRADDPIVNMQPGRRIGDAAWRTMDASARGGLLNRQKPFIIIFICSNIISFKTTQQTC